MKKFGYTRLLRKDISILHKLYYRIFGVATDHKLRFMYLKKLLEKEKAYINNISNILDAGCGSGDYSFYFAERFPNSSIFSIDVVDDLISKNNMSKKLAEVENVEFNNMDILALNHKEKYDFIYCIDVLEHISDLPKALDVLYNAMKFNGYLFIHIPLAKSRPVILDKYLVDFHEWEEDEHVAPHQTKNGLFKMLRDYDLKIIHQQASFNHYLGELAVSLTALFYSNSLRNQILKALISPLALLLIYLDIAIEKKSGNAIAVLLKKENRF